MTLNVNGKSMRKLLWRAGRFLIGFAALCLTPMALEAGEFKLRVQLVWGTDHDKPRDKDYKAINPEVRSRALKPFRWKNYWVVNDSTCAIKSGKDWKRLKLNEKGAVDLQEIGDGFLRARLVNLKVSKEGEAMEPLKHSLAALKKGEIFALSGADKEVWGDAWFVIITAEP